MSVIFWVETMHVYVFPNCDSFGLAGFAPQLRLRFQIHSSFQMKMSQTARALLKISHFWTPYSYLLNFWYILFAMQDENSKKVQKVKYSNLLKQNAQMMYFFFQYFS